jgi:hypothetical protein
MSVIPDELEEREDLRGRFALTADPTKEILVAVGRHPFGARQVAFPDGARPLGFVVGVHAQDDPRRLCPICTLRVGIEKPQICDQVVFVVILALRMCLIAGGLTARRE